MKERIVDVPGVKLCSLVEENVESIASSVFINQILEKYMIFEDVEDEVFKKIDYLISNINELRKNSILSTLIEIKNKLNDVDKNQDKYIEKVFNLSSNIGFINRKSNGILKFYDVQGSYRKYKGRVMKVRQPTIWEGTL